MGTPRTRCARWRPSFPLFTTLRFWLYLLDASVELQIQATDIGDYHNVGAGLPMLQFSRSKDDADEVDQYDPTAPFRLTKNRVFRSGNFENAPDQWTTVELVARGADAVFIVNGFVVNRLFNLYRTDLYQQTTSGRSSFRVRARSTT